MSPDFSATMLASFLRARAYYAVFESGAPQRRTAIVKALKDELRQAAGVSATVMHMAWMGWLISADGRARLWAALGHFPSDHGILLTDDGGQESSAPSLSSRGSIVADGGPNG